MKATDGGAAGAVPPSLLLCSKGNNLQEPLTPSTLDPYTSNVLLLCLLDDTPNGFLLFLLNSPSGTSHSSILYSNIDLFLSCLL